MGPWFHQEVQAIHLQQTRTLQTAAWMRTNNKLWQLKKLELPSQTATKKLPGAMGGSENKNEAVRYRLWVRSRVNVVFNDVAVLRLELFVVATKWQDDRVLGTSCHVSHIISM
jgi:hypothetical protein